MTAIARAYATTLRNIMNPLVCATIVRAIPPELIHDVFAAYFCVEGGDDPIYAETASTYAASAQKPRPVAKAKAKTPTKSKYTPRAKATDHDVAEVLRELHGGIASASKLAKMLDLPGPVVSAALKRLEKAGVIASSGNRRGKTYTVTQSNGASELAT